MKITPVLVPVFFAGVAASAVAETRGAAEVKKPVTQWTCEEFLALDDQFKPSAVYWATAYAQGGDPEASELDIAGTETVAPMVIEYCEKEPKASFWEKLKTAWDKVEAGAKKMGKKL